MVEQELLYLTMDGYPLGSSFCRKGLQGEECVFLLRQINISVKFIFLITLRSRIQLVTNTSHLIILSLYRAPSGKVKEFLRRLNATLKYMYNPKSEFIICGDVNMYYLIESSQKKSK
jgi:hypothetical protein